MERELSDNVFDIVRTTDESTHEWVLRGSNNSVSYGFDYATRVANANRPEQIALYGGRGGYMSVAVRAIDATVDELNELLMEDCEPFTESDLEC